MKKMFLLVITLLLIFSISPHILNGGGYSGMAECHIVIDQRLVAPGILHVFIDKTCDRIPDIVMEYQAINGRWVYTGRWWWL